MYSVQSTPSTKVSRHVFQKTGLKQRSEQDLDAPANVVQLSAWHLAYLGWDSFSKKQV